MRILQVLMLVLVPELLAWEIFHRGRHTGGNLVISGKKAVGFDDWDPSVTEHWFTQILDHFNPNDNRTWQQRYFVNQEYYNSSYGGPVFLEIGGESEASKFLLRRGMMIDNAKKYGALCFELEHRYYGDSHPTEDLSTENLEYLSVQQALADLAEFISAMNEKYEFPPHTKWIAFGGSYSGSLAAWLRLKYPHLVHGAVSSSSVLAAKADYSDYFKIVADSLRTHSEECVRNVEIGTAEIDVLLRRKNGAQHLEQIFNLCDPLEDSLNNSKDISALFDVLAGQFADIVQYNKDNIKGRTITIDTICKIMEDQTWGSRVNRLAAVNKLIVSSYGYYCIPFKYRKLLSYFTETDWNSKAAIRGDRQWTFQTCTDLGLHSTSSHAPHVFSHHFPVEYYFEQCVDIFGPKYNSSFSYSATKRTNSLYGALDINVSNVVFVHGSMDPWHQAGVTKTVNPASPVIYIE
ncbi:hypothetical protein ILUMI_06086, partial [Ignelater luminosus]